jgi:phosphoribosylformimino-5-aminoimidazole carboxamide ribotide isomerase
VLEDLVELLAEWSPIPVTYAGGVNALEDLDRVKEVSEAKSRMQLGL